MRKPDEEPDQDEEEAEAFERELGEEPPSGKPPLLRAVESILTDPEEIRLEVQKQRVRLKKKHRGAALDRAAAEAMVSACVRKTMLVGGATSAASVVPGLGTLAGAVGGALADAALCMKYEVEMVQGVAFAFGRDVTDAEEQRACLLIAGVGALAELGKSSGTRLGTRAFLKVVDDMLAGNSGRALKVIFRLLGLRMGPRTLARLVPFGVGVSVSVVLNRALSKAVGKRAIEYYEGRA